MTIEALKKELATTMQVLKSFNSAPSVGGANHGKTGLQSMAIDSVDAELYSVCATDDEIKVFKGIKTKQVNQLVHSYRVETSKAIGSGNADYSVGQGVHGVDVSMQVITASVGLHMYAVTQTIGTVAEMINDAGGYSSDIVQMADKSATYALVQHYEKIAMLGCDSFLDASGEKLTSIGKFQNGSGNDLFDRQVVGLQQMIRTGEQERFGWTSDFAGAGNDMSIVHDLRGGELSMEAINNIQTSVRNSFGQIGEALSTPNQLNELRNSLLPMARSVLSQQNAVSGGTDVSVDGGFSINGSQGPMSFISSIFKYKPVRRPVAPMINNSFGGIISTPSFTLTESLAKGTMFPAGKAYIAVIAINRGNRSYVARQEITLASDGSGIQIDLVDQSDAEAFEIYFSAKSASDVQFSGYVKAQVGGTSILFKDAWIGGLDTIILRPTSASQTKAQVVHMGEMMMKRDFAQVALANQSCYFSIWGMMLPKPKTYALLDNVGQGNL